MPEKQQPSYTSAQKIEFVREVFQYPRARELLEFLVREKLREKEQDEEPGEYFNTIADKMKFSRSITIRMLAYLVEKGYAHNTIEKRQVGGQGRIVSSYVPTEKAMAIKEYLLGRED
jgi:predicted transcriptional regulator